MPITLGSNIASLRAQRQLAKSTSRIASVFERLSSGQRINRASDDAAGIAIADSLQADSRVFSQALRNLNDGISAFRLVDSALSELSEIVIRQKELAQQSANGVYSTSQRAALHEEANALVDEYNRIIESVEFNGRKLLESSSEDITLQVDSDSSAASAITLSLGEELSRNVGTGFFESPVTIDLVNSNDIDVEDINGDGHLDLIASGISGANAFSIALGNGDGTFQAQYSFYTASTGMIRVEFADINNDNKVDFIATGSSNSDLLTFLGNGDGSFASVVTSSYGGSSSQDLEIIDLDGDGILDVVSSNNSGSVSIVYGNGDGTFQTPQTYATFGTLTRDVEVADYNGDGILDFVVAENSYLRLFEGDGSGSFNFRTTINGIGGLNRHIDSGDINDDGIEDLVVTKQGATGEVRILLGNGDSTFEQVQTVTIDSNSPREIILSDINTDGTLDVSIVGNGSSNISVLLGNRDGTFEAERTSGAPTNSDRAVIADFNKDGVADFVAGPGGTYAIGLGSVTQSTKAQYMNLRTQEGAREAMGVLDSALSRITSERGAIGATLSRLAVTNTVLTSSRENYLAAESRIRDADIASEAAQLAREAILQQAASAILSQANQQPAIALQLLA